MLRFPSEALTDALSEVNMVLNSNTPLLWQAKAATEVSQKSKMSANGVWRGPVGRTSVGMKGPASPTEEHSPTLTWTPSFALHCPWFKFV